MDFLLGFLGVDPAVNLDPFSGFEILVEPETDHVLSRGDNYLLASYCKTGSVPGFEAVGIPGEENSILRAKIKLKQYRGVIRKTSQGIFRYHQTTGLAGCCS